MPKRTAKSDHMQRKSPTWIARVMEERMENVSGCCRNLAHHRKPSVNAMWCRTCHSEIGADIVWPGGSRTAASEASGATPMLVAKDRRTGMVFALTVERKGAADPHAVEQLAAWVDMLESSQMAIRSD